MGGGAVNSYKKGMKLLHTCDGGCYGVWDSVPPGGVCALAPPTLRSLWVIGSCAQTVVMGFLIPNDAPEIVYILC